MQGGGARGGFGRPGHAVVVAVQGLPLLHAVQARPRRPVQLRLQPHNKVLYHASPGGQLSAACPSWTGFLCQFTHDALPEGLVSRLLAFDLISDPDLPAGERGEALRAHAHHLPQLSVPCSGSGRCGTSRGTSLPACRTPSRAYCATATTPCWWASSVSFDHFFRSGMYLRSVGIEAFLRYQRCKTNQPLQSLPRWHFKANSSFLQPVLVSY